MTDNVQIYKCDRNCCTYKVAPVKPRLFKKREKKPYQTAGCFIYDSKKKKILLVQSYGLLWGAPKGGIQENENTELCAIREVKEEAGLDINKMELNKKISIYKHRSLYYIIEQTERDVNPQINKDNNDANGIGYFHIDCLKELISKKKLNLNFDCKYLIYKIFDLNLF
jgi:8-oxo-dGTP pyrophosphatase MutT (NUDIX family)